MSLGEARGKQWKEVVRTRRQPATKTGKEAATGAAGENHSQKAVRRPREKQRAGGWSGGQCRPTKISEDMQPSCLALARAGKAANAAFLLLSLVEAAAT